MAVIVFAESGNGKIKKAAREAIFYGSKIANGSGDECVAVAMGDLETAELERLGDLGVSKVLHCSDSRNWY